LVVGIARLTFRGLLDRCDRRLRSLLDDSGPFGGAGDQQRDQQQRRDAE
jgi:hypothetical protein